jgi:thiol-disulfide isomerase/thioredoxin
MKKLIMVLLSILIIVGLTGIVVPDFSPSTPAAGAPAVRSETRNVLVEDFTADWCSPCRAATANMEPVISDVGEENFILVAFHVSDTDAMATAETKARGTAYGVSPIPHIEFDSEIQRIGTQSSAQYRADYDTRRAVPSKLLMKSGGVINGNKAIIDIDIQNTGGLSGGSLKLNYVLMEDAVDGESSYGTFNDVVRDIIVDDISTSDFPIQRSKEFTISSSWDSAKLTAAIFVQTGVNGEVHQAKFEDFDGPLNAAPTVSMAAKTEITINEDEVYNLNAAEIFNDPEGDPLTISIDPATHFTSEITGTTVKLTPEADWNGEESITVYATDGGFHTPVPHTIKFTVTPVNDAPMALEETKTIYMLEDSVNKDLILDNQFTDVDGDTLTYSVEGNTNLAVNIMSDSSVEIDATGEFVGQELITFKATDPSGAVGPWNVNVDVGGVNDGPLVTPESAMADFSFDEDTVDTSRDLSNVFIDPENDKLYYGYESNKYIDVKIDDDGTVTLTPLKNWYGKETITFKAKDQYSSYEKDDVEITVLPVNDAPVPEEVFEITIDEDVEYTYIFEASDVENDKVTFETNIRSKVKGLEKGKNYFFDESTGEMTLTATNEMVGIYTIQLKVQDDGSPSRESDPIDFTLYIENTNDVPRDVMIIEPAPGAVFKKGAKINFLGSADDYDLSIPDTEEKLNFQWRSDNVLGLIGQTESFSISSLDVGEHRITLTVYDSMNDANSASVTITIIEDESIATPTTTDKGDSKSSMSSLWWIIAALIVVIVVVLFVTMIFTRKKKPQLTPEEEQLQSYYDQLQEQGMLEAQTQMYGYQQPAGMGYGYQEQQMPMYPQQQMQMPMYPQQQAAYPQPTVQQQPMMPTPQPAQPPVSALQPQPTPVPQLPPGPAQPQPEVDVNGQQGQNPSQQPKDWQWNF